MIKKNIIHAKLVSPCKIELFWSASELPIKVVQCYFNHQFSELTQVIRIYDVTHIIFNGLNAHHFFEIAIPYHQGFWTIKGLEQDRSYIVEIGVKLSENKFFPLIRSHCIYTSQSDEQIQFNRGAITNQTNQANQDQSPVWTEHVSTYSYYKQLEEKNGW